MRHTVIPGSLAGCLRSWLMVVGVLALAACGEGLPGATAAEELEVQPAPVGTLNTVRIRLMAANTTSGNNQSYDPGHGIRIFQGTDPDIVMIQEFNYGTNSATDLRRFVDTAFGTNFSYYREGGAQIPNGVISRWPIVQSGEWDDPYVTNRDFAYARIDIPGPKDLWVVSVHLLTSSASTRNSEAISLVQRVQANIPAGDYLTIAGDFNTGSRSESCFGTFSQVVVTSGGFPVDQNNNGNTNAGRSSPYDHVLVDGDLNAYRTPVVIGSRSFTNGLVVDTRVYTPLADLSPALSGDSGATNMQHMAVIKDFLVPGDAPAVGLTVSSPNGGESWAGGSSQAIAWTASGLSNVKLEYTLDGTTWSLITASTAASTGRYTWTVPSTASTAARVRVSDAAGTAVSDTSNAAFTITVATPGTGNVFINEILANEPGTDVSGEFVELVNSGTAAVDLSGWTVSDGVGVRHTFASGTSLAAGASLAVFGGSAGIPSGLTNAVGASTGTLGLGNSGDTVSLRNASSTVVDSYTYASSLSSTDAVSMNRSPDASRTGSFVLHTTLSSLGSSAGKRASGASF
jgi:endonuclease/exonuclease/phosphatase family metal-dependent hydrolase